ncbi:uncharacterized protein LOC103315368 isoform X2 [Nasonia vitripennis]|uniref:Uncharacterized protein n=1 Tax=Nasonia vitripennis TaxID=7425 RepID=A0A7M7ITQ7_NASVI|nr:uncharacterized protein LOC103315368 isoform X2 [Nasonia vitripennis]
MNRRLHIDGALCKSSRISFAMENEGYVPFDLVIQPTTMLTFSGMFEQEIPVPIEVLPTAVTFENINQAEGLISIDGFVRMKFTMIPSRFENASYGCGSITDGRSKLTVNITNFIVVDNIQKGVAVNVVGTVDATNGTLCITCNNMNAITLRDNTPAMSDADLAQGGKPLKRLAPVG